MRLLLDTHVLIWWAQGSPRIPASWRAAMTIPGNEVFVSAVTAWEVEIKKRAGKLDFPTTVIHEAALSNFTVLPISGEDASLAGALEWDHKDPFDRLLVAQAIENRLVLVTRDAALLVAPGVRTLASGDEHRIAP